MANPEADRVYTQEDVQQILNLAIAQHAYSGEFTRAQLLEVADDLAIPAAIVHQAEQAWMQSNNERLKRDAFDASRRATLKQKVVRFAIVNTGIAALQIFMGLGFLWPVYLIVLVCWSVSLGLNAWTVFHSEGEAYEKAFQRWHRGRQVRTAVNRWIDRLLSV